MELKKLIVQKIDVNSETFRNGVFSRKLFIMDSFRWFSFPSEAPPLRVGSHHNFPARMLSLWRAQNSSSVCVRRSFRGATDGTLLEKKFAVKDLWVTQVSGRCGKFAS